MHDAGQWLEARVDEGIEDSSQVFPTGALLGMTYREGWPQLGAVPVGRWRRVAGGGGWKECGKEGLSLSFICPVYLGLPRCTLAPVLASVRGLQGQKEPLSEGRN